MTSQPTTAPAHRVSVPRQRISIIVRGAVQGVGFRPFVYRLATELALTGWVLNSPSGVFIEAEGRKDDLDDFLLRIEREKPTHSFIQSLEASFLDPVGFANFEIRESRTDGELSAVVVPDIAACPECIKDIFDPSNRRYLYPFTNCTHCGPRFSIIESLPYDRRNTSMRRFAMCATCREEYLCPENRRFHAQPNACPACGPHLEIWDHDGDTVAGHHLALQLAAEVIRTGGIVALKGLGGFQLIVDARNENAVRRLRLRKHREEKPFAMMVSSVEDADRICQISDLERRLLLGPEAPIVILRKHVEAEDGETDVAPSVAPGNPNLGIMMPYTPLHHILLRELGFSIVATSGNLTDEPLCTDEHEALRRLNTIADMFLVHNRPILRHVDDSVTRIVMGREQILRRARGYAPLPLPVKNPDRRTILAVGGHLKNTVALTIGDHLVLSQHIGDLSTEEANRAFVQVVDSLTRLYAVSPDRIISDAHPDYLSTTYAVASALDHEYIQHHFAHVASCMAENRIEGPVLGVSWDGTGYGTDNMIWGGEFLVTAGDGFERVATMRSFLLPGGEISIKQPCRTAIGLLFELFGDQLFERNDVCSLSNFSRNQLYVLRIMLEKGINSPRTTSIGRLFDAVSSLLGVCQHCTFEGQAAMELEYVARRGPGAGHYVYSIHTNDPFSHNENNAPSMIVDWEPTIRVILDDQRQSVPQSIIATRFHNTLAEIILDIAGRIGQERVVLSGGCFQNLYLTEQTVRRLTEEGFRPYWHQRIPPNDGGIAAGQAFAGLCAGRSAAGSGKNSSMAALA